MVTHDQAEIAAHQHEVQRLLGRCLLRLQQYERLLKSMLAVQQFSGTPETIQHVLESRRAEVSRKTLGTLVGRLLGDYIMKEGSDPAGDMPDDYSDLLHASFRFRMNLPDESYERLSADLRELVTLRNMLVHNFIDFHDLWTVNGCVRAKNALVRGYVDVDRHVAQLTTFAEEMDESRKAVAAMIQSPMFLDAVLNGIPPDGKIHWPIAGIVGALRQAHKELHVDGWANLDAAALWASKHYPEQTPQKYGCTRWRHVVHVSGQFDLRRFTHNGLYGAWFRARPDAAS